MTRARLREALVSFAFVGPAVGLYLGFVVVPALLGFTYGLTDWSGWDKGGSKVDLAHALASALSLRLGQARGELETFLGAKFIGLANLRELLADPTFCNLHSLTEFRSSAVGFTLCETVLIVLTFTFASMLLAVLLDRVERLASLVRGLFFYPFVLSLLVSGLLFVYLANYREGAINKVLECLGLARCCQDWMLSKTWAPWFVYALMAWTSTGFFTTLYLAHLQTIAAELYEAARLDGATAWAVFRHIQFPLLRPTMTTNSVLALITGINLFPQVVVTTGGGPGTKTFTIGYYIYSLGRLNNRQGYASAVSFVAFVGLALVALAQHWLLRRQEVES